MTVLALDAYSVVLSVHIMAVVAGFGLPLAYPLYIPYVRRNHPEALPGVHQVQARLNRIVTGPATVIILVCGIYLATDADLWSEIWVTVPFIILIVIGGVGGAIINPTVDRMVPLATQPDGPEYSALYGKYMRAEQLLGGLVLVAIFFMAAKP